MGGQRGGREHVGGRALGDDPAVGQQRQPVGVLAGEGEVVQRAEHGEPVLAAQPVDQVEHLLGVAEVERRRRLVEQEHPRLLGQRPGQHGALLLAAGERGQRPVGQGAEAEAVHDVGDHLPVDAARAPPAAAGAACGRG